MKFKEFVSFDKMITPAVIKIVFWIGIAFSVLMALISFGSAFTEQGSAANFILSFMILLVGPLLVRIYCELIMLGFKMVQSLGEINEKLDKKIK